MARKHKLIIEGMRIPDDKIKGVIRNVSKGKVYWKYHGHRLNTDTIMEFFESLKLAKETDYKPKNNIARLIDDYRHSPQFKNLSPTTQKGYSNGIKKILATFGEMKIKTLNDIRIRRYAIKWRNQIASASASDQALKVFKVVIDYAYETGELEFNHLKDIKRRHQRADKSKNIYTDEDIKNILKFAQRPLKEKFLLGLFTGQRISDILRMKWSDIQNGTIHIKQQKTKKEVYVPITPELQKLLDSFKRTSEYLIPRLDGKPYKGLNDAGWMELKKQAGCTHLRFHDLRGTYISRMRERNIDIDTMDYITGNKSVMGLYTNKSEKLIQHVSRKNLYDIEF